MLGVFLDTETTGLNPKKHTIIEIAYRIIDLSTEEEKCFFHAIIKIPKNIFEKASPSSLKVNGFDFKTIETGLEESVVKENIITSFKQHGILRKEAVFICQNPSFDRAFFSKLIDTDEQEEKKWPYHWLDLASMYWGLSIVKKMTPPWATGVSKDHIAAALGIPPEASPHRAKNGVDHLIACYKKLVGFPKGKDFSQ